ARIINVVHRCVPLSCGDAVRLGILGSFNVDAVRRARSRAKKASDTFFKPILIAMQHMNSAIPRLEMHRLLRGVFLCRFSEIFFKVTLKPLTIVVNAAKLSPSGFPIGAEFNKRPASGQILSPPALLFASLSMH